MKEETGLTFTVYKGGMSEYRNAFYMGAGYTDEASSAVFGYAKGELGKQEAEDTETISVILADQEEVRRILKEEKVSLRCAYLLMNFLQMQKDNPFAFLG